MNSRYESAHRMMLERLPWEQRQRVFSTMRHDGLRRRIKPFPTASDSHYPAIDMAIRKQKPFWLGQIMSGNRLASFVSTKPQADALAEAAADWFNFRVFQKSNFLRKMRAVVDVMLLRGRGVLKVTTDPFNDNALVFEAIDPMFLLVPDMADDLKEADEFVHIQQWTVGRYQRNRRFDQSPDTLRQIRGVEQMDTLLQYVRDKQLREGITHSTNAYIIILWEHWVKSDNGWTVYTYSPQNPELEIRKPFGCPYRQGGGSATGKANGGRGASLPFFSFQAEVKDEGWYSPRGLGEILAPVESYLCKLWNEKSDAITFSNRPVLTADGNVPNASSLRWQPGEIIPANIKGVSMPPPPISYDEELAFAASIGEQQSMTPDFGISDLTNNSQGKPRTATENQRISALQSAGMNDNAMIFRDSLTDCYRHIWGLLCQFKGKEFSYYASGGSATGQGIGTLPEAALHDEYLIFPDGAPDGWNRQKRLQMAIARLQAFQGNPNVSMEELTKEALYADDPRLALKAFIPTNQKANSEAEAEALDILVLKEGYPAAVLPGEDHATRILVDLGWLQKQGQIGAPVNPADPATMIARERVQQHMALHWQYLKQTDPEAAKQLAGKIAQMERAIQSGPGASATGQPPSQAAPAPIAPQKFISGRGGRPAQPDIRDVEWLRAHPTPKRIAKFERTYGRGSSKSFLNQAASAQQ